MPKADKVALGAGTKRMHAYQLKENFRHDHQASVVGVYLDIFAVTG